ncbi:MAG: sigma-70 family RNA polymerase sigma factor [Aeriscardovia sp.]|nr:sigma-70 family RNA polymerase sigma factor [Aeriscardovia sp.]
MKRVFIDMDNVLVDFQSGLDQVSEEVKAEYAGRLDEIPGLFAKMKPMEGAIDAVHELQKRYDLFILSTAPWKNPSAWSDKVEWVTKYLDDVFHKRMVITHRKDLCQGDYLIDDRGKNGTSEFAGEWIEFGSEQFPNWESVLDYLAGQRLDEYLVAIGREKLLSLEEELALVKAIQQKGPDCEEKEQFVKSNQRFVISVAVQYQRKELTLEELIEIGNEGLVKAAEEYDLNADSNFISYTVERMRQRIVQAIGEKQ